MATASTKALVHRRFNLAHLRVPFRGDLTSRIAALVLVGLVFVAVFYPWLDLGSPTAIGVGPSLQAPSLHLLAGTDSLGRSQLPRLAQGLRTTFLLATVSVALTSAISVVLGMIAAYYHGAIGELITRGADVLFTFPSLLLAILVVAITGPGQKGAEISIVLICAPLMIRVVRAVALTVVNRDFVIAAKVGRVGAARVLLTHILPNVAGAAVVQATYNLSLAMLIESGLSFLGLGVQAPAASLGSLVNEGSVYLSIDPWLVLYPGVLLAITIMCVNLVGDGLRDILDVRGVEVRR
jgi:peptide/nickel transport system permease protein